MYENYDPLTGKPYQSANFSWTAASYLLLLANPIWLFVLRRVSRYSGARSRCP
jgi:hypothetical protein